MGGALRPLTRHPPDRRIGSTTPDSSPAVAIQPRVTTPPTPNLTTERSGHILWVGTGGVGGASKPPTKDRMPAPPHRIHRRSRQPVPIRRVLVERALPPVVKTRQIAVGASARSERGAAAIEMAVVSSLLMIILLGIIGNSSVLDVGNSNTGFAQCVVGRCARHPASERRRSCGLWRHLVCCSSRADCPTGVGIRGEG